MIVVIIAGGSGTRLWPLSTPDYPKHLLKIQGESKSLLQNTYARAKWLSDKIYVVSEVGHIHHVKDQLPDLTDDSFIVEPARRGTASCILSALVRIGQLNSTDEPIVFLAADHYIRDVNGFAHSFKVAADASKRSGRIVLIGVEPDYPATGFGYIEKGTLLDEQSFIYNVNAFKEKPNYEVAQDYLKSGNYLWNCSYFVGSIDAFTKAMKTNSTELYESYQKLINAKPEQYEAAYLELENISIDYALIEKVPDLLVLPASFDWLDLGSYSDLTKAMAADNVGNNVHGNVELEEVSNSYVHNSEDKPIAVIGFDNCVVINTPQGILVTRKDLSQKVGEVSKRFNN
jgi:mannose-1-phosphate guanylyltransferase/mannose-6-phosphate isomerase